MIGSLRFATMEKPQLKQRPLQHQFHQKQQQQQSRQKPSLATSSSPALSSPSSSNTLPTTSIASALGPYAELVRLWKPVGFLYLYMPCLFGTLLAASLAEKAPSAGKMLWVNIVFFVGSFLVRCLGCTWNDICDQDFDRKVERTKKRPMARGAISTPQALVFLGAQLLFGTAITLQTLPLTCFWLAVPSMGLVFFYALAKRVTNYPQVVLGVTFSWGIWLAFPALDQSIDPRVRPDSFFAASCLFLACTVWTVMYDTAYAAQDIKDDLKIGIGSTMVRFVKHAKTFLSALLIVFTSLMVMLGISIVANWQYYSFTVGAATLLLARMIWNLDLGDSKNCLWWFNHGSLMVGGSIASGLGMECWARCAAGA